MNNLFGHWGSTLRKSSLSVFISMLLPTFGMSISAIAAERIYASYSALERSISVKALENYVTKGVINDDLAVYKQYVQPQQLEQLRRVLVTPIQVSPVAVSQFLYTPQGEFLLRRLTQVIKTKSRQPQAGFHALRSALILAASEPSGLTLLNVLRKYPNSDIQIDLARTLAISGDLEKLVSETNKAIAAVDQKSNTEAAQSPVNFTNLPDLRRQGRFKPYKQTLKYFDAVRQRLLSTDIYLPNSHQLPVIVISHGVGSESGNFEYLANHLASHGFAVVVPNHPGSDAKQMQSLLDGRAKDAVAADEFENRPLDVKYILDQLEKSQYKGRLNLQQVGVIGQSFGGYTALALAGAQINFQQLAKDCKPEALKDTWNLSLLLQCRALELRGKQSSIELRDPRVKAAIALNPITSSVFGEAGLKQIQTPVMFVASSDDTIAPALYEQIRPFPWIANSQKYLVILSGASHFSVIGDAKGSSQQVGLPSELAGNNPSQTRRYINVLSLPFFETYVAGTTKYVPYLNAGYVKKISRQPVNASLIQSLTTTELAQALKGE